MRSYWLKNRPKSTLTTPRRGISFDLISDKGKHFATINRDEVLYPIVIKYTHEGPVVTIGEVVATFDNGERHIVRIAQRPTLIAGDTFELTIKDSGEWLFAGRVRA